jgi:hypothetical protein
MHISRALYMHVQSPAKATRDTHIIQFMSVLRRKDKMHFFPTPASGSRPLKHVFECSA